MTSENTVVGNKCGGLATVDVDCQHLFWKARESVRFRGKETCCIYNY